MRKFHILNEYGQDFRRMRKERYEIVYEHAEDIDGPWTEYQFLYKPTNENSSLPFAGKFIIFWVNQSKENSYRRTIFTSSRFQTVRCITIKLS